MQLFRDQAGFSILGVLVIVSTAGLILWVLLKQGLNLEIVRQDLKDSQSYQEVESELLDRLKDSVIYRFKNKCDLKMSELFSKDQSTERFEIRATQSVSRRQPSFTPLAQRCRLIKEDNNQMKYYGCFEIEGLSASDLSNLGAVSKPIVEFAFDMIDARSGNSLSCSSYIRSKTSAMLRAFYSIHWEAEVVSNQKHHTKSGVFYAKR